MAVKRKAKTPKQKESMAPSKWRLQHGGFSEAVRAADPETGTPIAHRYAMDSDILSLAIATLPDIAAGDSFSIGADLLTVRHAERDATGTAWRVFCQR